MSNRGAGVRDATVPPQLNGRSEAGDPLDTAAQQTLDLLHRAAVAAEANNQQAIEVADKLSAQLRAAEDRIRELEARIRHHQDRADRTEKWLYQISMEIERHFFNGSSQPPPQASYRNQPR
jgi:hypothetical protein